MDKTQYLYTFNLIDGRQVTYSGNTELVARKRAESRHPGTLPIPKGKLAELCLCKLARAYPRSPCENNQFICSHCGGYLG